MNIEMPVLWLVKDCIISCYSHPVRGDYNTGALIFNTVVVRFLDVSEEETNQMKEYAVAPKNNLSNYT